MKEYKIGEEFQFEDVRLRVEECSSFKCENSFFGKTIKRCFSLRKSIGACTEIGREDGVSVKFVKIEEMNILKKIDYELK